MQLWDDVLYPEFVPTIKGAYYGIITQNQLDEECFHLAVRAIAAFKFPKITTEYTITYMKRDEENNLIATTQTDGEAIPHGSFINNLTCAEIAIIIAWMKVYWCEEQISNADSFEDTYTDANIKTYSRANALDKATSLMKTYREYAKELESNYSRVDDYKSTLGDINADE